MSLVDFRFRNGADETLVLQVAEQKMDRYSSFQDDCSKWQDAKVEDLLEVAKLLGTPALRSVT